MARINFIIALLLCPVTYASSRNTTRALEIIGGKFQNFNSGLGIFSRSKIVSSVSRVLRGEENVAVEEGLRQAIVTLAILDVGGGFLAPITQSIVDIITNDKAFKNTAKAWTRMGGRTDFLEKLQPKKLGDFLTDEKENILRVFQRDVDALPKGHRTLRHIKKAQKWLRLKTAGQVLGPIFDLANVGVNAWALGIAIRDCVASPSECNRGSIAAASLNIASGMVGLGTFALALKLSEAAIIGPVAAIIGFVLAITATIIELTYTPPPSQAQVERQADERKELMMLELDRYSRLQLFIANKFITESNVERSDLYIVNQGHLPKWFDYPTRALEFGWNFGSNPRERMDIPQKCDKPIRGFGWDTPPSRGFTVMKCPYLIDGVKLVSTNTPNKKMGAGFYGFTKKDREYEKWRQRLLYKDVPYNGTILLVSTDKVQEDFLSENEVNAKLRGLYLSTDIKGGDLTKPFQDLIAIGDMPNLGKGERIKIATGAGNDALNIDGRLGEFDRPSFAIDATLGSGHNTLSFDAMAYDSPIQGIEFDAKEETLRYEYGSDGEKQDVGIIRDVQIISGSPFKDYIKLHSHKGKQRRSNLNEIEEFDFTVFKFKGSATYEIDVSELASQSAIRNFKIIDTTDDEQYGCENNTSVLKLTNFDLDAYANDILYTKDRVEIYGKRLNAKRSLTKSHKNRTFNGKKVNKRSTVCSGEPEGSHPEGGKDGKVLLAKVALYSKCPVSIEATNQDDSCMMKSRKKSDLDIIFFDGKKLEIDFTQNMYQGGDGDDFGMLKCPDNEVTTKSKIRFVAGRGDSVVVGSEQFLDPCGIDGGEANITLKKTIQNKKGLKFKWTLEFAGVSKFSGNGSRHTLIGVDKIINEFGDVVVDMRKTQETSIDVYDAYTRATMREMGNIAGRDRSQEVRNNLLRCIKEESEMTVDDWETILLHNGCIEENEVSLK